MTTSIVWLIRAAMAMIAGSIVVLLLVGVEGLRDIRRAQSVLSDQAVPALVQVEVFSERLRDIDRAFDKMLAAETSSAHSEHTANISTILRARGIDQS